MGETAQLGVLAELARFETLAPRRRLVLAAPLAELLGPGFLAHHDLVGAKGLVAVDHTATGIRLIAIPGGSFAMGFIAEDEEAVSDCVDDASAIIQGRLQDFEEMCSPVRVVDVPPFLLSLAHVSSKQMGLLTNGGSHFDVLSANEALSFMAGATELRLPSEAELEYAGREGGTVAFLNDGGRIWKNTKTWPNVSGWGFEGLSLAAWAADEWHANYDGAPVTSAPWRENGLPGVYRGGLLHTPDTEEELLFGLACWRGRLALPDDEWDVGLRVAKTLTL